MRGDRFFTSSHSHWMVQFRCLKPSKVPTTTPHHPLHLRRRSRIRHSDTRRAGVINRSSSSVNERLRRCRHSRRIYAPTSAHRRNTLLLAATAAACRLRRLFDCGDCDAGEDEPMLETDRGRARACCTGSRWRVRIIDNFRRMMLPSGITLANLGGGAAASETDGLDCVGSGVIEARERLNGDSTLYATGGCGNDDIGEFARSRSRLPRDELALVRIVVRQACEEL